MTKEQVKMLIMAIKYCSKQREDEKFDINKRNTCFDIDYDKINKMIKDLKPKQSLLLQLFDHSVKKYHEDADVVIKVYQLYSKIQFSMKVFYINSAENTIHPMYIGFRGHSYELEFNHNSTKFGMEHRMQAAIDKIHHMCREHFYGKID